MLVGESKDERHLGQRANEEYEASLGMSYLHTTELSFFSHSFVPARRRQLDAQLQLAMKSADTIRIAAVSSSRHVETLP